MSPSNDRLFVYGTLMRGHGNPMAQLLAQHGEFLGAASCQGRLYRIAHYPGLLLSDDPAEIVFGELFRLPDPAALLPDLDAYEGCGEGDAKPTAYLRQIIPVTRDNGRVLEAWTYVYNWPVQPDRLIVSGRFEPA
jgi:gamma-glutamylcyclotransferase (GGCT)/AIG2-like uncharacterized protein YtfP